MLRTLLRLVLRSGSLFIAPLTLALEVPTLLETERALGGNWVTTLEIANGSASLLIVLGAMASCTLALGWVHHHEVLTTPPRGARVLVLVPALLGWAPIAVVHLLWVAAVCLASAPGTRGSFEPVVIVPVPLAILAGSLLGVAAAYVGRSWLAPPFVGLVLFVALVSTSGGNWGNLLGLGGVGHVVSGIHVRPQIPLAQSVWFLAVAVATGVLLLACRAGSQLRVSLALALFLPWVGGAGALVVMQGPARFELISQVWTCRGHTPAFCWPTGQPSDVESQYARLTEAARRWQVVRKAPQPAVYWQRLDIQVPGHDNELVVRSAMTDVQVMHALLSAAFPCSLDWSYEQYRVSERLAGLLAADGLDGVMPKAGTGDEMVWDLRC